MFELIDLEDADRTKLLNMSKRELAELSRACNRYPSIDLTYTVGDEGDVRAGNSVKVDIQLDREWEEGVPLEPACAPFYPKVCGGLSWLVG